jgi:hypothetical protein
MYLNATGAFDYLHHRPWIDPNSGQDFDAALAEANQFRDHPSTFPGARLLAARQHPPHAQVDKPFKTVERIDNNIEGPVKDGHAVAQPVHDLPAAFHVHASISVQNPEDYAVGAVFESKIDVTQHDLKMP